VETPSRLPDIEPPSPGAFYTNTHILIVKLTKHPLLKTSPLYAVFADKYIAPKNYEPWNVIASQYSVCGDRRLLSQMPGGRDTQPIIDTAIAANVAADLDSPAIYLDPNLAEAVLHTDVTAMDTPKLVLPSFFICLPKNLLYDDEGIEINSLLVTVNSTYVQRGTDLSHLNKEEKIEHIRKLFKLGDWNGLRVSAITSVNHVITVNQGWQEDTAQCTVDSPHTSDNFSKTNFNAVCVSIMRVVKNVILLYNYQKDLIHTVNVQTEARGFAVKERKRLRSPLPVTLLGKDFLARKEIQAAAPSTKTGIKVRPHWRKGHWHTVLTGEGRVNRKLRWFQPVYVNLALDT
jgi:hypothetical protein